MRLFPVRFMLECGLLLLVRCYTPAPRRVHSSWKVFEKGLVNGCVTVLGKKQCRYSISYWASQFHSPGKLRLFLHQSSALWPLSKTTFSGVLWPQGRPDKHTDSGDKYIFLFTFVSLLCFLHHFLRLLEFCIHQLLLQFSVFKYFVQVLRKNKVHISSLTYYWCWKKCKKKVMLT